ncbi:MAG: hypothetical protein HYV09_09080 [Deltaproteobacteria bacterium]|nr:hypothetical protein [Deltaproteobacteria bacterium]
MRRKTSPSPILRGSSRPLRPAHATSVLPTAAAIALALAELGCSTKTVDAIAADPQVVAKPVKATPAPSASPALTPYLPPDPHDVDGEVAFVKPAPSTSASATKKTPAIAPTAKPPKLGGKPMPTDPTI